jgi:hypothetical protein
MIIGNNGGIKMKTLFDTTNIGEITLKKSVYSCGNRRKNNKWTCESAYSGYI